MNTITIQVEDRNVMSGLKKSTEVHEWCRYFTYS